METIQKVNVDGRRGKLAVFSGYQDKRAVSWKPMCKEHSRTLESLALSEAMKEEIMSDLNWFFSHGVVDCFRRRGIAHRRALFSRIQISEIRAGALGKKACVWGEGGNCFRNPLYI